MAGGTSGLLFIYQNVVEYPASLLGDESPTLSPGRACSNGENEELYVTAAFQAAIFLGISTTQAKACGYQSDYHKVSLGGEN